MRNTREFRKLLRLYLRAPRKEKSKIYKKLERCATSFFDYCMLFQFGDKADQIRAFNNMAKTFLNEKYPIQVHQNIMDLCMAIDEINAIDEKHIRDKEKYLDKFFRARHEKKEDLLFYLAESKCGNHISSAIKKVRKFYKTYQGMQRGFEAKMKRNKKLCQKSTFLSPSLTILNSI